MHGMNKKAHKFVYISLLHMAYFLLSHMGEVPINDTIRKKNIFNNDG